jgi:hypothetical protein
MKPQSENKRAPSPVVPVRIERPLLDAVDEQAKEVGRSRTYIIKRPLIESVRHKLKPEDYNEISERMEQTERTTEEQPNE